MGKVYDRIDDRLRSFIEQQAVFFVATAPLAGSGHVNVSPKGRSGSLTMLDDHTVAYLDFGGSHAETLAHLRENGRITLMWCAFTGPPAVVRIHGRGEPVFRDDPRWLALIGRFGGADGPGVRAIIRVTADLISETCGFAVPFMDYQAIAACTPISSGARQTSSSPPTALPSGTTRPASTGSRPCRCRFRPAAVSPTSRWDPVLEDHRDHACTLEAEYCGEDRTIHG